jgi:hypothetical protein
MPTILVVVVGSAGFRLRFLLVQTPLDPLPNFVVDPISTPLLTISMPSATIVSTHVVVILTLND